MIGSNNQMQNWSQLWLGQMILFRVPQYYFVSLVGVYFHLLWLASAIALVLIYDARALKTTLTNTSNRAVIGWADLHLIGWIDSASLLN